MAALAPSGLIHSCSFVYLRDRKSTRLNSSHLGISYAVFCLKKNIVGTLKYVAPEALSGELVDGRADIYSLATITYWLLTGRHPYSGKSPRELFQQLLTQPPTPLNAAVPGRRFPARLEAAVMQGLERDPARRQPTVTQFADAVAAGTATPPAPSGGGLFEVL